METGREPLLPPGLMADVGRKNRHREHTQETLPLSLLNQQDRANDHKGIDPEDFVDATSRRSSKSLLDFTVTTGWNFPVLYLLLHGLVAFCWGIALFIFALGVVPVYWGLSQAGKTHPGITNTLVSLVAALSTTHIRYVLQLTLEQYSRRLVVVGFTIAHLRWMQGVRELSLFTKFPLPKRGGRFAWFPWKRMVWIITYTGIILHTSSLVAILQPQVFFKHKVYDDAVPCGVDASDLTLDVNPLLAQEDQDFMDSFSFNIGRQLPIYGDQLNGNTTTSISGRVYSKDSYAYGAIGGLEDGLQEIPGSLFNAQCSDDPADASTIWEYVFPNRSVPSLSVHQSGYYRLTDDPVPLEMRTVTSYHGTFNISGNQSALYALVQPTGSGALWSMALPTVGGESIPQFVLVCSWNVSSKLVSVQTVDYAARTLGSIDSLKSPSPVGRTTLMTLKGMAQAYNEGASLQASPNPFASFTAKHGRDAFSTYYSRGVNTVNLSQILETILADGGKAGMTIFNVWISLTDYTWPLRILCHSNNRTVQEHWRFGNSKNLGWFATIWTTAIGALAIYTALWAKPKKRMQKIGVLEVDQAFALGRGGALRDDEVLHVVDGPEGKIVV
ncbi:hypothetical protein CPC08DRAFT_760196 [Agrocybe pediades]|nr:hypothetical protein CPC08DRAFT_760196 [Agrocybe pediades]